jgi:Zn-dependent protease with chaperone function
MLLCLLLGVLATLIAFPETPVGRTLHRVLVEPLARRLNRIRPGHLIFAATLIAFATTLVLLFEWEGVRLVGMAAPEVMSWLAMFDAAAVLDLAALAVAMAATTRFRTVRDRVSALADQVVTAARRVLARGRRRSRPTAPRPPRSDDPDPAGWPAGWKAYAFG